MVATSNAKDEPESFQESAKFTKFDVGIGTTAKNTCYESVVSGHWLKIIPLFLCRVISRHKPLYKPNHLVLGILQYIVPAIREAMHLGLGELVGP